MENALRQLMQVFGNFNAVAIIDIFLLSFVFYYLYQVARKYNSTYLVAVTIIVLIIGVFATLFEMTASKYFLKFSCVLIPFVYLNIFRSEVKREIWKRSRQNRMGEVAVSKFSGTEIEIRKCIQVITRAVQNMSKKNVGALIIVIPSLIPMQIAESGVFLNSDLSSEIIENIFTPNTPLHDGAMLVSGNKILASGCFLPLTQDDSLPKDLGTRHRAGIGITEMTDVLSIIVSEETGVISTVRRGVIERYVDATMLTNSLEIIYGIKENIE